MRSNWLRSSRGFTLIELMVALVVSGFILLGARLMLDGLASATDRTQHAALDANREANADHLLRMLFTRLEVGLDGDTTFGGDASSMHFTSWCYTPFGWLERCDAVLAIEVRNDTSWLIARLRPSEPRGNVGVSRIVLARGFRTGTLRYLNDARAGGHWFVEWGDGIVSPLAAAVVLDGDTTILRIGERS